MKKPLLSLFLVIAVVVASNIRGNAQSTVPNLKQQLDSLTTQIPALDQPVDITVNMAPLGEFMRGIARESGLNVTLDPAIDQVVTNNFSNVKVKDVLYLLSENYGLSVTFAGSIVMLKKREVPQLTPTLRLKVDYNAEANSVSIDAEDVPMEMVTKEVTVKTGKNIVLMPGTNQLKVRTFIRDMPLNAALEKMAMANNARLIKSEDGFLLIEPVEVWSDPNQNMAIGRNQRNTVGGAKRNGSGILTVKPYAVDSIDVIAVEADANELFSKVFDPLKIPYQLLGPINETITMNAKGVSIDKLMESVFVGTKTASRKIGNTYWIGPRELVDMSVVRVVSMQNRTVDSLMPFIPDRIKNGVEIKEFTQQNSLVLAGPADRVDVLESFLKDIDKVVPLILIEVMIVENKNTKAISTGITAGLADKPVANSGTISPGVDMTIGTKSVNDLIEGLNGFGWLNLGKVNPNFYMTIKALEEDGYIDLHSTPQLATLNGHQASLSIGNTEYYKEELNTMYGSVTTSSQKVTTYKPVEAELKIVIKPIVSDNRDVTLHISVEQSDFTERISEFAPPGKVSRKFQSLIRVQDQEMVLLGGLEEKQVRKNTSGFPILSRIPILKWIFTSHSRSKNKSKLSIFIKPTIII